MSVSKDVRIQSRLEPVIHQIMIRESSRIGMKPAKYMRWLILKDLKQRGVLDSDTLIKMAIG